MAPDRKPHRKKFPQGGRKRPAERSAPRPRSGIRLRQVPEAGGWELVHPRCVEERADDLDEVRKMIDAGEFDLATEELRWLLEDCRDFIEAHKLLGELAAAEDDIKLARAHFGYAYDLGLAAFPPGGLAGPLPYALVSNRPFLEAAKGLAWALVELEKRKQAEEVLRRLLACDPADPLGARAMLAQLHPGGQGN